jgi:hypothetical protein
LANGQLVRGVTKNEDTFSIQIMDENEKLHMLLKTRSQGDSQIAEVADAGGKAFAGGT